MRLSCSSNSQLSRMGGFTLVELLVTMALLSLLMLGMASALRTMAQTEERVDARLADADEFRVATGFLRSIVGRISARKNPAPMTQGASPYMFAGAPTTLSWVGIMPARYGAGGRHFFRLGVEPVNGEAALVLRFLPWVDSPTFPDWSQAEARVLVTSVTALSIRYEDAREVPSVWGPEWPFRDRLPQRLELTLQTTTGFWPSLVIPLRVPPVEGDSGGFVIGGSS